MAQGLVLCMIVKDEEAIIGRALRSARPHVSAYAIVDTGSSDATIARAKELLGDLPGEIIARPWADFSSNRNQSLELALSYGSHALILDADEELQLAGSAFPALAAEVDLYWLNERSTRPAPALSKPRILRLGSGYRFTGVIHESIAYDDKARHADVAQLSILAHYDGARSQGVSIQEKYLRDARVLEAAVAENPTDSRSWYYLGMSYLAAGDSARAEPPLTHLLTLEHALPSELFDARMRLSTIARKRADVDAAEAHLRAAAKLAPHRSDPLIVLAELAFERGEASISHALALRSLEIAVVNDGMFIDADLQFPRRQLAFLAAARAVGDLARARQVVENVLRQPNLTEKARALFVEWRGRLGQK
jgi:tetratricopeptide (TPR) repeat protein